METLWFVIVAFMLAMYVVLDGFDLGAGILHLMIGKTEEERRSMLRAIGPVWDGNEVWLLAAGGTLFFAFPKLYASSFSGFYLPLVIVLWLLMLRGLGIEFRHHIHHPLWKTFWDVAYSGASLLLSVFLGAALGNVVRGVPLNSSGYFFEPLWTTFMTGPEPGILDWFTVLLGIVALCTLTAHGGHYIALKTSGILQGRARLASFIAWCGIAVFSLAALYAVSFVRPDVWINYHAFSWGYVFPSIAALGLVGMPVFNRRGKDSLAFLSSSLFIAGMLASTAFGLYPNVLPSSSDPSLSLTVWNSSSLEPGLSVGIVWWITGMVLVTGYFTFVYRAFRGKVDLSSSDAGY